MKTKTSYLALALTILTCSAAQMAQAADPAGYELFNPTNVDSYHLVDVSYSDVQTAIRNGYRPIAMELTSSDGSDKSKDWRFSVALIENTGIFERDTLFLWNYTEQAMYDLQDFAVENNWWHWVPIDVKSRWVMNRSGDYERRYAFVFVENTEGWEWRWKLDASEKECVDILSLGWRAVAMTIENDSLTKTPYLRYDAAFVRNAGGNAVNSTFFRCNAQDIVDMGEAGWQVIRCQYIGGWDSQFDYNAVFVETGNSFQIPANDGSYPTIEINFGRMIDLRGTSDLTLATFLQEN